MSVSCILRGGLGNQLFQIYTTLAYALEHNLVPLFPSELEQAPTQRFTYWDSFFSSLVSMVRYPSFFRGWHQEREEGFHFTPLSPPGTNKNILLNGYFQSYKYFDSYKNIIRKWINIPEILPEPNTISIHFRRGDYKNYPNHHPILSVTYYEKALDMIFDKITTKERHKIYVFCEDNQEKEIQDICDTLFHNKNVHTICHKHSSSDWEELLAMASCQHHILANSTFSWWGAYLSNGDDGIVVYPKTWFGPALQHHDTRDMCCPNWFFV